MLSFGSKINRKYSLNIPFHNTFATFNVYYHKNNSFVGIDIDPTFNKFINESVNLHYNLYLDIKDSIFTNVFLDITNSQCHNLDIKNQFNGIKESWKHKIYYISNESISLQVIKNDNGDKNFYSMLYIYLLTLDDSEKDFVFIIAERQHIDKINNKKIVRSCGAQLATKDKLKYLNEYKYKINQKITLNDIRI